MMIFGAANTVDAYLITIGVRVHKHLEGQSLAAVIRVIEYLDNFLPGFVLIYFVYNTYFLFVHDEVDEERWGAIRIPSWLRVENLGQMKQVPLQEAIVAVFFLRLPGSAW